MESRIHRLGHEIFERAAQAVPKPWQGAWWLEQMTALVDVDPRLKAAAFQFVECLPVLRDDREIARHLWEYFTTLKVPLPRGARWALDRAQEGGAWASWIGWGSRRGARAMAGRFVIGHDAPTALKTLRTLRREGRAFTLDVLGESTTSEAQADRYIAVYHDVLRNLGPLAREWSSIPLLDEEEFGPQPRVNLSLKLTGMTPHFDPVTPEKSIEAVNRRLRPLLRRARSLGAFVNVDMESHKHRALTLDLLESLLMEDEFRDWKDVGIVVQAYLRDGEADLHRMLEFSRRRGTRFAIRLVKGAYWDSEVAAAVRVGVEPPVWTQKWQSDACYERCARLMLENRRWIRPCFASHNVRTLAAVMAMAEHLGVPVNGYELQALYGMVDPLKQALVGMGRCLRVYSPYGDMVPGMAYLIRRLLENTSNDSFLKQGFSDHSRHDKMLADPAQARPSSNPLPRLHDADPFEDEAEIPMRSFRRVLKTDFSKEENRRRLRQALQEAHDGAGAAYPLIIEGRKIETEAREASVNPANPQEVLGHVAQATVADADVAVATAVKALTTWKTMPTSRRCDALHAAADLMEQRRFSLAAALILECGMPWGRADAEVAGAVDACRFYAEQASRLERRPRRRDVPGEHNRTLHVPRGACAVTTSSGSPLAWPTGSVCAALACGNTVVLRPDRPVSVVAFRLVEALLEAGVPSGAVAYLPGSDPAVTAHLACHHDVAVLVYAGAKKRGLDVIRSALALRPGQRHFRHVVPHVESLNAIIVDDDADLDAAINGVMASAFSYAGQGFDAVSRVIVLDSIHDPFVKRLEEAVGSLRVGPAEEAGTLVGPVIDPATRDELRRAFDRAEREGRLLARGTSHAGPGYFVEPVVLQAARSADATSAAIMSSPGAAPGFAGDGDPFGRGGASDPVKGPVLTLLRVPDFESALRETGPDALIGGLYSRSPAHVERARQAFEVGALFINRPAVGAEVDLHPIGGYRLSGAGPQWGGAEYLFHFTHPRSVSEYTLRHGFSPDDEPTSTEEHALT